VSDTHSGIKREVNGPRGEIADSRLGLEATTLEIPVMGQKIDQLFIDMHSHHKEVSDLLDLLHAGRQAPKRRRPRNR
jgi:hypothetical protein